MQRIHAAAPSASLTADEVRSRMRSSTSCGRLLAWLPFAVFVFEPEDVLEPVRDSEAVVSAHLGTTRSGHKCIAKLRPVVLPRPKFLPVLPALPLP